MARRKNSTAKIQQKSNGIMFQLSPGGIVGIGAVLLCLFLWMFLLGIWAGQTILYPSAQQMQQTASPPKQQVAAADAAAQPPPVEILRPVEIKKRIAPPEPQ
jgi:hypothetical protein